MFIFYVAFLTTSFASAKPQAILPEKNFEFLNNYCLDCHDAETEKGEVNLEDLSFHITTIKQAEQWQAVLDSLNSGEMPPEKKKQPSDDEKANFLDDLAQTMVTARKTLADSGGKITMRRLNRREYQNTLQELLGVKVETNSLPQDGGNGTYDTSGSSQFVSSDQFEQYLKIGKKAALESFQRRSTRSFSRPMVFRIEPEETVNPVLRNEVKELDDQYERFLAWRAGVDKAAAAPENKEIMAELLSKSPDNVPSNVKFYKHAHLLKGIPDPKDYGFRDIGRASFSYNVKNRAYTYFKHYIELPHNDRGTYLKTTWGTGRILIKPPAGTLLPGTYKLRIKAGIAEGAADFRQFIQLGHPQRQNHVKAGLTGVISTHQITGSIESPEMLETEIVVGADTPHEFAIQERQPSKANVLRKIYGSHKSENGYGNPPSIWIDWIELEGPIQQKETLLDQVMKEYPLIESSNSHTLFTELGHVRKFLTAFARVAMRETKPSDYFMDRLLEIYKNERTGGEELRVNWNSMEEAISTSLSIILASPGFIYLNEPGKDETRRALNQRELAVRLAYFLWSSPPDRILLNLAKEEKLKQPEILRQQVDRMITDPRSEKFVAGFVHQWFDMDRLDFFQFDGLKHRDFDESTRTAARQEVYQSFLHLLRGHEGGNLANLLDSDYVMINGLLATYYGIPGVTGDKFRKVQLPTNSPRGGLLGMAAIHAMGSDGIESSPVERGSWVLRHLLHSPPPPAPANVPQISRLAGKVLTSRERLIAHQEKPQCASCHRKIDPIGYGLENFNAAGKWRTEDHYEKKGVGKKTWTIDASGAFYKGPAFANYFELRDRVADQKDAFARGFTEALVAYGLGRSFAFTDEELASKIIDVTKKKNYSLSQFIHTLVQTKEFQSK